MPRPFAFTTRDFKMVQTIAQLGVATATQLTTLYFYTDGEGDTLLPEKWQPIPHSNCQARLKLLSEHGYIDHIEQQHTDKEGRKKYLHMLTTKGAKALAGHLGCEVHELAWRKVKTDSENRFLEHLKWINECRVVFTYAALVSERFGRKAEMLTWIDDAQLKRMHSKLKIENEPVIIPDSYFQFYVEEPDPFYYYSFLEADLGTETGISSAEDRATWERKVKRYITFFGSGMFKEYYKAPNGRVLTVTTSEKRLAHLKAITEQAGGRSRFLFTTVGYIKPILKDCASTHEHADATNTPSTAQEVLTPVLHTILTKPIWQKAGKEGMHGFWIP